MPELPLPSSRPSDIYNPHETPAPFPNELVTEPAEEVHRLPDARNSKIIKNHKLKHEGKGVTEKLRERAGDLSAVSEYISQEQSVHYDAEQPVIMATAFVEHSNLSSEPSHVVHAEDVPPVKASRFTC